MKLSKLIKQYRTSHKLTMQELADKAGLSKGYISQLENEYSFSKSGDKMIPSIPKLQSIAAAMDMTIDDLFKQTDDFQVNFSDDTPNLSSISNIIPLEKMRKLPILGIICAGNGIWCEESYDDYIMVDRHIKADFALIVKGDSMIDANIHDGDIAFFKKQETADSGQIVAVLLTEENEATLKKYIAYDDIVMLQPCNSDYPPIINKEFIILGILKGLYKEIK